MSYQVMVEYLPQGSHWDICVVGCGIVALDVTVSFSSVVSPKNNVVIENMRQKEFLLYIYTHKAYNCACTPRTPYCNRHSSKELQKYIGTSG
jgi:hypothetical protein